MSDADDRQFMARALELAERGVASTDPNPSVGCVIVSDGKIVGEGFTQRAGGNHAEIEALNAAGDAARGATVYVTLEPCSHTGRTGPCATALIEAAVSRVVFAQSDPNPSVAGRGAGMLEAAGIATRSPLLEAAAEAVNPGYLSRMRRGRPWIRLKMAASLDGRTALANGKSQWITGEAARRDVHRFRARSSAVMTGIGTVLADNPSLTARPDDPALDLMQPARIVLDSDLKTPPDARLFESESQVVVFTGQSADGAAADRYRALSDAGAKLITVPAGDGCDLSAVAEQLNALELNEIWVEAGPTLAGAMLAAGLVDQLVLYFAPCVLGNDARGLFDLPAIESLDQRVSLVMEDLRKFGQDLRIILRPESD